MPAMSPGLRHLSFPGESMEYRAARNALLVEEIELRRQIERVANQRRALPTGGIKPEDYQFDGNGGRSSCRRCLRPARTHWRFIASCTDPTGSGRVRDALTFSMG
jgi:Bacterial protein of unknown function (DUF899)